MTSFFMMLVMSSLVSVNMAFAAGSSSCDKIAASCKSSGFVVYSSRVKGTQSGHDLWADCYCPIMQGKVQPAKARIPLPTSDQVQTVAQCKQAPKYADKCQ